MNVELKVNRVCSFECC